MQKSMLVPSQNISFLGVELNSIKMRARLSEEHSQKLISSLAVFKLGCSPLLKCFQWTLGQMAAASTVCNLGLLHMRLLQLWLKSRVPQNAWHMGTLRIKGLVYTAVLDAQFRFVAYIRCFWLSVYTFFQL